MSTFKLNKVDTLPEISRAGRKSEELNMIIAALNESVNDGNPFRIDGIEAGNAYNSKGSIDLNLVNNILSKYNFFLSI